MPDLLIFSGSSTPDSLIFSGPSMLDSLIFSGKSLAWKVEMLYRLLHEGGLECDI